MSGADGGFQKDAVRDHFDELSARYGTDSNQACKRAYDTLTGQVLAGAGRVLELGAGPSPALAALNAPFRVASDLSQGMLRANPNLRGMQRITADAQCLPFAQESFDAVFCINVLEHVPAPGRLMEEAARVLRPGGLFFAITPNGGVAWLLELLEQLHLKLPEGPHRFLSLPELHGLLPAPLHAEIHRRFLAFPAGSPALVHAVDRLVSAGDGLGLFQYLVARKT